MIFSIHVGTIYTCSLERAFKTPMLTDVSLIHTGYGLFPPVTHCEDDGDWGKVGGSKKVFNAKTIFQPGGYSADDTVLERIENKQWVIQVDNFQSFTMGFEKFVGTWKCTALAPSKIQIDYSYKLHLKQRLLLPMAFLFAKIFMPLYMKNVLRNIEQMIKDEVPYKYS